MTALGAPGAPPNARTATRPPWPPPDTPRLGSYAPEDVVFLLKDLGGVALERGTHEREGAIQSGVHYAEMLPVEYQPPAAYLALFDAALGASAHRLAVAVGLVAEQILARHEAPVLVSLARAGTPVGILLRRWVRWRTGRELPHYAVSIVRDRGIDLVALDWLLARYAPGDLQFVDGWTGKGAIARELAAAVLPLGLDPRIAVLADPGGCTDLYGTRDDFLIPSACLNSTVSGLVSRTVLRADLIGPGDFHGAKYYRELAGSDVSARFLDTVEAEFPAARCAVDDGLRSLAVEDRSATWTGWRAVERIAAQYAVGNLNLVKPGVGETTRVLLRRIPDRVLVTPGRERDLAHVVLLARERGVPVQEHDDLAYSCMGLIEQRE